MASRRRGVSFLINFFQNFFSVPILAVFLFFAVFVDVSGSFQQKAINFYIKSYENRMFFRVFRMCLCILTVVLCVIMYWFTVFFVDFVVLICIYTKLCVWFRHAFFRICSIWCVYVLMYCNRVYTVYVYAYFVYIYYH